MPADRLIIKIVEAVYNSKRWLPRGGIDNIELFCTEVDSKLKGISNLTFKYIYAYSQKGLGEIVFNFEAEGCAYNNLQYLDDTDSADLRNVVASQLSNISKLQTFKDIKIISSRDDLNSTAGYTFSESNDGLQIFIHDIVYHSKTYLDPTGTNNIDDLLAELNTAFDAVNLLEFSGVISASEKSNSTALFAATTATKYDGKKYLNAVETGQLKTDIETQLGYISDFSYSDVQIITSRNDGQPSAGYSAGY